MPRGEEPTIEIFEAKAVEAAEVLHLAEKKNWLARIYGREKELKGSGLGEDWTHEAEARGG